MNKENYPSLFQAADDASTKSQARYVFLMGLDLILMVLGALCAVYNFQSDEAKEWVYIVSASIIGCCIFITVVVKLQKFEAQWYKGRALSESVKTLTWRYITGSQNFEIALSEEKANEAFVSRLKELSNEFKEFNQFLDTNLLIGNPISDEMKRSRAMNLDQRHSLYLRKRIRDQKNWYSKKSTYNKKKKNIWFAVIIISQFLSVIGSVYLIKSPSSNINFVGLFTTVSAACLAWLQLKQHESLSQAYATAALELTFIEAQSKNVTTENEFAKFVLDSENAISREHTLWLAQKI